MTKNISSRDWETLSAYIDGYLSSKERQRLEERLLHSAELNQGLDELRRTRQVLRSQPKMRAPRNFTLIPDMVGVKDSRRSETRIFPVMRLASVLASILLVLVVVGDLLTAPVYQMAQMDTARSGLEATAAELPAMEEAAELEAAAPAAGVASEKALEPEGTPAGEVMMMAVPTEEAQDSQAEPPAALAMPPGDGGQAPEEQATAETEQQLPTETPLPTIEPTTVAVEEPAPAAPPSRVFWRTAEILLALIAISSGLVALYVRRTSMQ